MTDVIQRLVDTRLRGHTGSIPDDEEARRRWPTLWSFLTRQDVNGELAKDPASFSVRLGLGAWLVTLTDSSLEVTIQSTSPELADVIDNLEQTITNPHAPWSPWRRSEGSFRRVNKRSPGHPAQNHDTTGQGGVEGTLRSGMTQ